MPFLYMLGIFYLICEIYSVVFFVDEFGTWMFFFEVIISGILGVCILFVSRFSIFNDFIKMFNKEITPIEFLSGNFFRMFGAILLIFPGILSDVIGIILELIGLLMLDFTFFKKRGQKHNQSFDSYFDQSKHNDDQIIDVEIVENDNTLKQEK